MTVQLVPETDIGGAPLFASSSVRHWNCVHRRRAAPKLRRACRSSWTTPARTAGRGRTYSSFGPNCVRGHFSSRRLPSHSNHAGRRFSESSLQPSVCTHGFPDRIRKRGYSPCTGGGVSRGPMPTAAPKRHQPHYKAQYLGEAGALSSVTFSAYIPVCRGNPAMAINGRRNKPIGPGGSTRRLHQSPASTGFGGGEIGSTRA